MRVWDVGRHPVGVPTHAAASGPASGLAPVEEAAGSDGPAPSLCVLTKPPASELHPAMGMLTAAGPSANPQPAPCVLIMGLPWWT